MKPALVAALATLLLLVPPIAQSDDRPLTFSLARMGDMFDKQAAAAGFRTKIPSGVHLGFKEFEAPDGEKLWTHDGEFRTAEEANKYMNWKIHKLAVRGLKETNELNNEGIVVGRRVEFWIESAPNKKTWVVMWTESTKFFIVEAPTRESALEAASEP
jgi:hypothetical protein